MAVARNKDTLDQMVAAFTAQTDDERDNDENLPRAFYSGFSDGEVEGLWKDAVDGQVLAWNNWAENYPKGRFQLIFRNKLMN